LKFDIIISISVFSHLPPVSFESNLKDLREVMSNQSILFFTTHGKFSAKKRNLTIPDIGYRFGPVSNKPNHTDGRLSGEEYSFMCTTPEYVKGVLEKLGFLIIMIKEQEIGEQDLYVVEISS